MTAKRSAGAPSVGGFSEKVALVTGASSGIGRAVAVALGRRGVRVAVHYHRNRDGASGTFQHLAPVRRGPGGGVGHEMLSADLADPKAAAALIETVLGRMGRLDILVNNAGVFVPHPPLETGEEDWLAAWKRTLDTNLMGPAMLSFHAAQWMAEHGGGRIVCVSSRAAFRGEPNAPAYAASKAALNAMSQSLAVAFAPRGVGVGVVAPGFVETERILANYTQAGLRNIRKQSPLRRMATPEEVAEAVVFLASDAAIAATGTILDVNGASYLRS